MNTIDKNGLIISEPSISLPSNHVDNTLSYQIQDMKYWLSTIIQPKKSVESCAIIQDNYDIDPAALMDILQKMQDAMNRMVTQQAITTSNINSANEIIKDNINNMKSRMNSHISYIHNCASCGHPLKLEENRPIFNCPYCEAVYVIGPTQIYSEF